MICIRFAPGEGCDISGAPAELRAVAEAVVALRDSVSFSTDTTQPSTPCPALISSLVLRVGSGPMCAAVQDGVLSITAGPEFLVALASFFQFADTAPEGDHTHHEYFPSNEFVSPASVPLVISIRHSHPVA